MLCLLAHATPALRAAVPVMQLQGGSRRTWSQYGDGFEVGLGTDGRPIDADLELYDGPNNVPFRMRIRGENGHSRPIRTTVQNPGGRYNSLSIRNRGPLEYPANADVGRVAPTGMREAPTGPLTKIQGGAEHSFHFAHEVGSVQVLLKSDGMPLNATVELLQGPNCLRKDIEVYSDDGRNRPVMYTLETPGYGCVVRVTNVGPMEFPIKASVVPNSISQEMYDGEMGDDPYAARDNFGQPIGGAGDRYGRAPGGGYGADPYAGNAPGNYGSDRYGRVAPTGPGAGYGGDRYARVSPDGGGYGGDRYGRGGPPPGGGYGAGDRYGRGAPPPGGGYGGDRYGRAPGHYGGPNFGR